ncbi:MAG TPA: FliA/WhiG family RNA polymerase sigma factor [Capsulimonadaceae bacterium]
MSVNTQDINALWRKFRATKAEKPREALINHYSYLVKITATRLVASLPPNVDREDLVSVGMMGLIKAVDQFDPSRQVKFDTYAISRIRGAILETLRKDDWVPRSVRDKVKSFDHVYQSLESLLGRPPSELEVATELGISVEAVHKIVNSTKHGTVMSLNDLLVGGGESSNGLSVADTLADENANTAAQYECDERDRILVGGIELLPERQRQVLALYYYEDLTFKEIGKMFSVSESRVYQLHTQAVSRMRDTLMKQRSVFLAN